MNIYRVPILLTIAFLTISFHPSEVKLSDRPDAWAQHVKSDNLKNLFKVDQHLYRSEQPDEKGMVELYSKGIRTVLNLRNWKNNDDEIKGTSLDSKEVNINAWTINYEEILQALKIINSTEDPILVHCKHGSDRTGCIVAAYRMAISDWKKEDAIKEFIEGGFGFHEKWFPNIIRLLKSIDPWKLKADLKEN